MLKTQKLFKKTKKQASIQRKSSLEAFFSLKKLLKN